MPIYEYTCAQCAHQFEEIVLGREEAVTCPKCGSGKTQKLMSRCRSKLGGSEPVGAGTVPSGGGCTGCSGGSCASCG
ncbi:FmdB family zinc ribbon protein [Desulfovermiculus halophilus]|jgi:putative FmdB family regulatory protein|uniref:FmdB family zinc ribbon protein n=1 Tax=Desulfovermiculus halophilus TaxID=339722 RepID=UPI0004864550|nr:zinc ribbon domain-containing protein [Desulfovermiculus halophilus]